MVGDNENCPIISMEISRTLKGCPKRKTVAVDSDHFQEEAAAQSSDPLKQEPEVEVADEKDGTENDGVPYDTGWAWVVVCGCFVNYLFLAGSLKCLSVFYVEMLRRFDATASQAALVFSIRAGVFSISCPLVMNIAVGRLGIRKTVVIGALFMSLSGILASLANQMMPLICLLGGLLGLGHSMLMSPGDVLLGMYFRRRRSLAIALAKVGSSLGSIAMPPLVALAISHYGLSGALLLVGGVCLHCVPAAMLFRAPSSFTTSRTPSSFTTARRQSLLVSSPQDAALQKGQTSLLDSVQDGEPCTDGTDAFATSRNAALRKEQTRLLDSVQDGEPCTDGTDVFATARNGALQKEQTRLLDSVQDSEPCTDGTDSFATARSGALQKEQTRLLDNDVEPCGDMTTTARNVTLQKEQTRLLDSDVEPRGDGIDVFTPARNGTPQREQRTLLNGAHDPTARADKTEVFSSATDVTLQKEQRMVNRAHDSKACADEKQVFSTATGVTLQKDQTRLLNRSQDVETQIDKIKVSYSDQGALSDKCREFNEGKDVEGELIRINCLVQDNHEEGDSCGDALMSTEMKAKKNVNNLIKDTEVSNTDLSHQDLLEDDSISIVLNGMPARQYKPVSGSKSAASDNTFCNLRKSGCGSEVAVSVNDPSSHRCCDIGSSDSEYDPLGLAEKNPLRSDQQLGRGSKPIGLTEKERRRAGSYSCGPRCWTRVTCATVTCPKVTCATVTCATVTCPKVTCCGAAPPEDGSSSSSSNSSSMSNSSSASPLCRSPLFLLLLAYFVLFPSVNIMVAYLPALASENGATEPQAALLLSLIGGLDLVCRLAVAVVAGATRVTAATMIVVSFSVLGVAAQCVRWLTSFAHLVAFSTLLGLLGGVANATLPVVVVDVVGVGRMGRALGLVLFTCGASAAAAFPCLGYLRDVTGSYIIVYHVTGTGALLAAGILCCKNLVRRLEDNSAKSLVTQMPVPKGVVSHS